MKKNLQLMIWTFLLLVVALGSCEKEEETLPDLSVTGFSPYEGFVGTVVEIRGKGFSTQVADNQVKFDDISAEVLSATGTTLKVKVPEGAPIGEIPVTVSVKEQTIISEYKFDVFPEIGFKPGSGYEGTLVHIKGRGFNENAQENQVEFNGKSAEIESATTTEIYAYVPAGVSTGKVSVTAFGETKYSYHDFMAGPDFWTRKANLLEPLGEAVGFSIDSKGYFCTGSNTRHSLKDLWEYDPTADTWTKKTDLPGPSRHGAVGFSIGAKGYVGTGISPNGGYMKDFWEYDPASDTWTQKADFEGEGRLRAAGFAMNGKGYIGTGMGDGLDFFDFWEYDPVLNAWEQKADFPGGMGYMGIGFALGEKGYMGLVDKKDFWEYDPALDAWARIADYPGENKQSTVAFTIGTKGYVGKGSGSKELWEYDPVEDAWREMADIKTGFYHAGGFAVQDKGYVVGRTKDEAYSQTWSFSPE